MTLFHRLRERKLVQWGLAYLAGAWLAVQVVSTLGGVYGWPEAVLRAVPVVLGVGFAAALVLAWYHGERGHQRTTSVELGILTTLLLIAGLGVGFATNDGAAARAATAVDVDTNHPETFAALPDRAAIAVLPFGNMSADPEREFFSDGLTEELLNALGQVPGLRVVARTSSFAFKDRNIPIDSIGRLLRVTHLVEGSVRTVSERVRIQAQLVDATSGYQLWTKSYDRELVDIFAVWNEISQAIAAELRLSLAGNAAVARQETSDPEAHALLLRGLATYRAFGPDFRTATDALYLEAIRRDPGYARPHAQLARSLFWQAYFREIPRSGYERALAAAERALELDPELADAHEVRAWLANLYEWDFARADDHLRRALSINPGHAEVRYARAWLLMRLGRGEEALAEARRAAELDPLSAAAYNTLGLMYFNAGRPGEAEAAYQAALALAPTYTAPLGNLSLVYSLAGRHADALRAVERLQEIEPASQFTLTALARTHAWAGDIAKAQAALALLQKQTEVSPYRLATVHIALGDRPRALAMLEQAVAERDDHASWLAVAPEFESLRGEPRFRRLLARPNLSPSRS